MAAEPFGGRFEVGERVGGGLTGDVMRGVDQQSGAPCVIKLVYDAVFTDALAAARKAGVDGVQPGGRHGPEAAAAAAGAGLKVLLPIAVDGPVTVPDLPDEAVPLLDTAVPGMDGGTGKAFDWTVAAGLSGRFVVAGGLNPANAAEAVEVTGAWGVDVSSGIESAPGVKDPAAMKAFVEAIR